MLEARETHIPSPNNPLNHVDFQERARKIYGSKSCKGHKENECDLVRRIFSNVPFSQIQRQKEASHKNIIPCHLLSTLKLIFSAGLHRLPRKSEIIFSMWHLEMLKK